MRGGALLDHIRSIPFREREVAVDALLGVEDAPPDIAELPRGAVPYLPCGVDEIVAMVLEAPLTSSDVFVDIGSGLGRVVILAHLLSGARARGIEIQPPLVAAACALRDRLSIAEDAVAFTQGDAAAVELEGTVFFLYAPFSADVLQRVLRLLENVARRQAIVIAAVGLEIHDAAWLRARKTSHVALTLYDSVSVSSA